MSKSILFRIYNSCIHKSHNSLSIIRVCNQLAFSYSWVEFSLKLNIQLHARRDRARSETDILPGTVLKYIVLCIHVHARTDICTYIHTHQMYNWIFECEYCIIRSLSWIEKQHSTFVRTLSSERNWLYCRNV